MEHPDPRALVRPHEVHRDVYRCPRVFELEMQRLWARAWLYVGHHSQVPEPGDHVALNLGAQPVLMVRREDGGIAVLHNRCAHRGAPLAPEGPGRAQRLLRCPYHGWAYRLDGRIAGLPQRGGYADSGFEQVVAARGLTPYGEVAVHRGFVFARARADGPGFADSMGELLDALDLIADRSPHGRLRVAGGVLRSVVRANWKLYLENINDAFHPPSTHASVTEAASSAWEAAAAPGQEPPLALRQLLPFGAGFDFFDQMGARLLPQGHSILGTRQSIHSGYGGLDAQALRAAHGEERAQRVLAFAPQNVVFYPSMALKGTPQVMRVLRPLAPDRTLLLYSDGFEVAFPEEGKSGLKQATNTYLSHLGQLARHDADGKPNLAQSIRQLEELLDGQMCSLHRVDDVTAIAVAARPRTASSGAAAA